MAILGVIVAVIVVGAGLFLFRDSDQGTVFRYAFASGERRAYTLDMAIKITPRGAQATQPFTGRVRAAMAVTEREKRNDGTAILDLTLSNVQTDPPRSTGPLEGGRLRLAIAPDGRVKDVEGTGGVLSIAGLDTASFGAGGAADTTSSQVLFPQYPEHAIEPGDSWTRMSKAPLPFGNGSVDVRTDGRFEGYTDSGLGRAARVKLRVTTPIDYTVTIGELTKAAAKASASPLPTPNVPADARVVLDGETVTSSTAIVLPATSDLVRMDGTTNMTVKMNIEGVPAEQLEGAPASYAFDAAITMSIVRST